MDLQTGQMLAHYRLVDRLGQGGMGVVWKAIDTTLGREVAIKVLPEMFAGDAQRLARFEQEARLLASLNHPHIASVYSVHHDGDAHFLAMELVEGEDLAKQLARGRLPVDDALEIARQVAEALEAAHDRGIIHRDLKPANIQLTPSGQVKVLDFGLAKALSADPSSADPSLSPTMTAAGTVAGMILGTAAYMSPEQARGREVDRRADVWAFGCVLFEMLTGRRAFQGETISDILASVLKVDPDWGSLPPDTPAPVRRVLRRCLVRDPARRLSHVSGARLDLMDSLDGPDEAIAAAGETRGPSPSWRRALPWALVAVLAVPAGLAVRQAITRVAPSAANPILLSAPLPGDLRIPEGQMGIMDLSADGRFLVVALSDGQDDHLYLRRQADGGMTQLEGTRGAATPVFSPDGAWIAFFADDRLKKIAVEGGSPVTLCEVKGDNRGATWTRDDRIIFSGHYAEPLLQVPGAGGEPTDLTSLDVEGGERTHRWPHAAPEEDLVLFTVGAQDSPESYDGSRIDAVRPSTGERATVMEGASSAWYLPGGYLIFAREGFLFATSFDLHTLKAGDNPVPVAESVMGMRSSGVVYAAFASDGLLAYIAGQRRSRRSRLVWRLRDGTYEPLGAPVSGYLQPRLSPDGRQVAVAVAGESTFDIWTYDIERNALTRLTFAGDNTLPVWSPDGRRIAFGAVRDNALQSVYMKASDGSGEEVKVFSPESLGADAASGYPESWSPDGTEMVLSYFNKNGANVAAYTLEDGKLRVLLETPAAEQGAQLSPDGRWLAYTSDETGRNETYVRPYDGSGGKWQVSVGGGFAPRWSPDSTEIFYRRDRLLYSVKLYEGDDNVRWESPQVIFDDLSMRVNIDAGFDVLDRDHFLFAQPAEEENVPTGVTMVVNWREEVRRRVRR